jgi:DNA-binding protein H-NS
MTKLAELIAQRQRLEEEISAVKEEEGANALAQIRATIAEYGFTQAQVFGKVKGAKASNGKPPIAAKYRDPASGRTWSGRGKAPRWLDGKDRNDFTI